MSEMVINRPIEVIENEILFYKHQAECSILEIGRRLIEVKEQIPHGQWENWLAEKVEFSAITAQRFMRLAREYSEASPVMALGATKALALLALPESERDEFVAEKHDVNGEEKTVQEMSKRELEEAIRKMKAAEDELAKVKQEKLDAEVRADNFAREAEKAKADANLAQASGKKMGEDMRIIKAQLNDQKELAEKYSAEADELREELREMKNKPIEMAVREPSEDEIAAAAAEQIEAAKAEIHAQAEAEHAGDLEKIRELEKRLASADPETTAFRMRFIAWQEAYNKMAEALEKVERTDKEKAAKLRAAVNAAKEEMK